MKANSNDCVRWTFARTALVSLLAITIATVAISALIVAMAYGRMDSNTATVSILAVCGALLCTLALLQGRLAVEYRKFARLAGRSLDAPKAFGADVSSPEGVMFTAKVMAAVLLTADFSALEVLPYAPHRFWIPMLCVAGYGLVSHWVSLVSDVVQTQRYSSGKRPVTFKFRVVR